MDADELRALQAPLSESAGTQFRTHKKKMAGTKVPAKFEQGGFTSGRRKGPQTLFPGTSPGNLPRSIDRVYQTWTFKHADTRRNFFWLVCKNRNSLSKLCCVASAEPRFGDFPQ